MDKLTIIKPRKQNQGANGYNQYERTNAVQYCNLLNDLLSDPIRSKVTNILIVQKTVTLNITTEASSLEPSETPS